MLWYTSSPVPTPSLPWTARTKTASQFLHWAFCMLRCCAGTAAGFAAGNWVVGALEWCRRAAAVFLEFVSIVALPYLLHGICFLVTSGAMLPRDALSSLRERSDGAGRVGAVGYVIPRHSAWRRGRGCPFLFLSHSCSWLAGWPCSGALGSLRSAVALSSPFGFGFASCPPGWRALSAHDRGILL